jgi:polyisoprenyl-teichoic acid--peptidoglycan teichoic acid transferase
MKRARKAFALWLSAALAVSALAGVLVLVGPQGHGKRALASSTSSQVVELHAAHGASFVPALEGKRPLFILALGSDARSPGGVEHSRSDSIHLIGVNLKSHRASILGFPRDSWVNIPGHGTDKITTAMYFGGPQLTVATIESITSIRIDFWVLTSFRGLKGMVSGIGGLDVVVPTAMHDKYSGADFTKGRHHLSGPQALAFARDRHDVPGGDLGRSVNQGRLMLAALNKLHATFDENPRKILDWIAVGWREIHTDLDLSTMLDLALTATTIPADNVNNQVVPARTGTVGTASVVFISSSAHSVYADMRADGVIG